MRKLLYAVIIAVAAALGMLFVACASEVSVSLYTDSITLYVGESRDLLPYVKFEPQVTDERGLTLASDGAAVRVVGTTAVGVAPGVVRITIRAAGGKTLTMQAEVVRRPVGEFSLHCDTVEQTVAEGETPKKVTVTATALGYDGPCEQIEWSADGIKSTGSAVEFTPRGYGEFDVTARLEEYTETVTVKVYRPTDVTVSYSGKLDQSGTFSRVRFVARENADSRNPRSVFVWSVNGEVKGKGALFDFEPTKAGSYAVTLDVNGKPVERTYTVTADGGNAPCGTFILDGTGGVCVELTGGPVRYVSVIDPDGGRVTFDSTDAQYSHLFADGKIRLKEYIRTTAENPGEYIVILGGEGRKELRFTQLPEAAEPYINKKILVGNSLLINADAAQNWVRELYACGIKHAEGYIVSDANETVAAVRAATDFLGLSCSVSVKDKVLAVDFDDYVNAPSVSVRSNILPVYAELPHIEYDAQNRRPTGYVFASDRRIAEASVVSSEQLLYAVEAGFKPAVVTGSVAARIYRQARNVLMSIIGRDYTERDKAHAIYDWLQWTTVGSVSSDSRETSMYLESVFGRADIAAAEGRRANVTDLGAAKLFSFLCGIEGIECRTELLGGSGRYFYNKLKLDGLWYNVDVNGGKLKSGNTVATSHSGFLYADDTDAEHDASRTAFDAYNGEYMRKHTYNGEYFDYYIDKTELSNYAAVKAAVYCAFDNARRGEVSVDLVGSTEKYYVNTVGTEFCVFDGASAENINAVRSAVERAVNEYAEDPAAMGLGSVRITVFDRIIQVAAGVRAA